MVEIAALVGGGVRAIHDVNTGSEPLDELAPRPETLDASVIRLLFGTPRISLSSPEHYTHRTHRVRDFWSIECPASLRSIATTVSTVQKLMVV